MNATAGRSGIRIVGAILRFAVAGALLAFVLKGGVGAALLRMLVDAPWLPLLFTAQTLFGVFVETERLRGLLSCFGVTVSRPVAARVVTASSFFNACIPGGTGGDIMKYLFLSGQQSVGRARLVAVLFVDRALGLLSILIAAVTGGLIGVLIAPPTAGVRWFLWLAVAGLGGTIACLWLLWSRWSAVARLRAAVLGRLPFQRTLGSFARALIEIGHWPRPLAKAIVLSTMGQLVLGTAFFLAGRELMPQINGLVVSSLALLGLIANVIPATPGGLGVGEVAFEGLFRLAGVEGGSQLVLLWRLGAVPVLVVGGLLYAFGFATAVRRFTSSEKDPVGASDTEPLSESSAPARVS